MVQLQAFKGRFGYFQDQFSGMTDQFACRIKKLAPEGISIHRYRNHWLADIFFEGFEEVIANFLIFFGVSKVGNSNREFLIT